MAIKPFPAVEDLPRRSVTQVRTKWATVKRKVRAVGCVAITWHGKVEAVMMHVAVYRKMKRLADEELKHRR